MKALDLLSDTVYRDQAAKRLDRAFKDWRGIPVKKAQIYGLRAIARNQPSQVTKFADHQRGRAEKKGKGARLEKNFWILVRALCDGPTSEWSVEKEGRSRLPAELRNEKIPKHRKGMSSEARKRRKSMIGQRRDRIRQWNEEHLPAFFERFCSHALYLLAKSNHGRQVKRT